MTMRGGGLLTLPSLQVSFINDNDDNDNYDDDDDDHYTALSIGLIYYL